MRTLLAILLLALSTGAQVGGKAAIGGKAAMGGGPTLLPTLAQSCIVNVGATSVSCATTSASPAVNFTSGKLLVVLAYAGNGLLATLPTGSGSGCPSIWQNVTTGTDSGGGNYSYSYGTTQAGSCTVSQSQSGTATGMFMHWYVAINTTGHVDGTGAFLRTSVGAGTTTGASYTTAHSGVLVLGAVAEISNPGGDSTIAAINPFSSASPGQVINSLAPQGWAHMAIYAVQDIAGTITLTWTQGISTTALSWVLGVY